jgi:type IV pilus assembly PilX-like protein
MRVADEKGIALVLSIFLMTAMSIIAASLMFLSQTETYSSLNYRLMSQARYGAESGVHKAANYILYSYAAPGNTGAAAGDDLASYDVTKSPVQYNGAAVVLSADTTNHPSNYPVPTVQTAFAAAVAGSLPSGTTTVSFASYATLMSMQQVEVFGSTPVTIQTWLISATGTITAGRTAQVEVTATIETPKFPANTYAAFGTAGTCGALDFSGGTTQTDSYSSVGLVGAPVPVQSGGNVGTNGNLTAVGGADIFGMLSSPRVGIGSCSAGNVDAVSTSGGATVNGHNPPTSADIIQLPQAVTMAAPTVPTGVPTTPYDGNGQTLTGGSTVGDITVNGTNTLTLGDASCTAATPCTINVNSISVTGSATVQIVGYVVLNVVGSGQTDPVKLVGNSITNASYDPTTFQILYAGFDNVTVKGGSNAVAMIYAPNAAVELTGGSDFYGSVVGATIKDTGGTKIHYDRNLSSVYYTVGNAMMSSFSWKKY